MATAAASCTLGWDLFSKKAVLPTNWLKFELFEIVPTLMHTYSLLLPRRAKKPSRLEMGVLSNMSFAADSGSPFVVSPPPRSWKRGALPLDALLENVSSEAKRLSYFQTSSSFFLTPFSIMQKLEFLAAIGSLERFRSNYGSPVMIHFHC